MSRETLNELAGYPCIYGEAYKGKEGHRCHDPGLGGCGYAAACLVLPIYRAHIALREAVLGDMTAAEAAEMYRAVPIMGPFIGGKSIRPHFNDLADVVEKL